MTEVDTDMHDEQNFRVLRGNPDDPELAAALIALGAAAGSAPEPAKPRPTTPARWQVFGYQPPNAWSPSPASW
ncbi:MULTISPECIES: acyl-CoA carboxylase epsilon subunit [unclassified Saccharopolyspora]|uniref:acyl-CoA carboxylase epsilon subunit n=1 Tax=Saccharopolyspora TaxID=1835 RepID=UPI0025F81A69|nr:MULTISPECIES: acyl-CoA carboxylase epsilon subunit [unclassified Saccharopolyspora]MBK0869454.1 acyl-CoA carboxylase subunit epsilon [Saccharopolyspora sp. HNM0986]